MEKEKENEVNCPLQKDGSVTRANSLTHHSKASNVKQMMMSPIQQCSIMQHLIHNVVDMEGTIAMQITPEARGAPSSTPHSQWRQKHIIGESFDDRDDRHAWETFPYSD